MGAYSDKLPQARQRDEQPVIVMHDPFSGRGDDFDGKLSAQNPGGGSRTDGAFLSTASVWLNASPRGGEGGRSLTIEETGIYYNGGAARHSAL